MSIKESSIPSRRVELKCATSQDPIDRHAKERIKELLVRKCAHVVQEHLPELLRLVCLFVLLIV